MSRRQDIVPEIDEVYRPPQRERGDAGLLFRQRRIAMEVGGRVAERSLPEPQEALHIPALDQLVGGVDINGEIEEMLFLLYLKWLLV